MRQLCRCAKLLNSISAKTQVRHYGVRRFKIIYDYREPPPVEDTPSLQQILKTEEAERVNIGLPLPDDKYDRLEKIQEVRRNKTIELEEASHHRTLRIPLDQVEKQWLESLGPRAICSLAEHFNIFEDLFGRGVYFYPSVPMKILYSYDDKSVSPVYRGNYLKPKETRAAPSVSYPANEDSLWTLLLTNPDGVLTGETGECVHWLVGNIPGSRVGDGEEIFSYIQPFPPRGLGYQRMIFILFKQEHKIDLSWMCSNEKSEINLSTRFFHTGDFYKKLEDYITPAGLAFFQCNYDDTLKDFFHNQLHMKEPVFEYDWPPPLKAEQQWFPKRKPFNEYMDRYRDPKDVAAQVLKKRLKGINPFKKEEEPFPYPLALKNPFPRKVKADWLILEEDMAALKAGKYKDL